MSRRSPRIVRLSVGLFSALQRLLPDRRWRRRRDEARALFRDLAREAHRDGGAPAVIRVLAGSLLDLARRAPEEYRASRAASTRPGPGLLVRLETVAQDARLALRGLAQRPLVGSVVVLTLALGIGANAAIFSMVRGVLLRELPYAEPDRIVRLVGERFGERGRGTITWPNFDDVRRDLDVFQAAAAYDEWQVNVGGLDGEPVRVDAATVTTSFFRVLGVRPAVGRFFTPDEDVDGQDRVVVLSHGFWSRHLGADPGAVGGTLLLDDRPHRIVGVAPASFEDPLLSGAAWGQPAFWRPLGYRGVEASRLPSRGSASFTAVARLAPGVSRAGAQARVDAYYEGLRREFPEDNAGRELRLVPLHETMVSSTRATLLLLFGTVLFVLAIASVNVAGVLLGRAAERRREGAIRAALGAGRGRLVQLFLVEGVLLAGLGGAAGLLLAATLRGSLVRWIGDSLPRAEAVTVDPAVVGFAAAVSVITGVGCGLLPAWSVPRGTPAASLVGAGRSATAGRGTRRARALLVAVEVGMAVTLLVGAGLMLRTLWSLQRVDPGFDPRGVLAFELAPSSVTVPSDELIAFYAGLLERLEALPGVEASGGVSLLPLSGSFDRVAVWDAAGPKPASEKMPRGEVRTVTPGYFQVMGVEILRGRGIRDGDGPDDPPVVVLSETLAQRLFPGQDALGRRVTRGDESATVVGIVADVRELELRDEGQQALYVPHAQGLVPWHTRRMKVVLRAAAGDPVGLGPAAREVVRELAPDLPVAKVRSMERIVAGAISAPRLRSVLLGAFACLAVLLAAVGIYGVVAFSVIQRRREMAIRMALGASSGAVVGDVVRSGLAPVAAGTVAGLLGGLLVSATLGSMLHGITPLDPVTYAGAATLLPAVATLAAWLPARRAVRLDLVGMLADE